MPASSHSEILPFNEEFLPLSNLFKEVVCSVFHFVQSGFRQPEAESNVPDRPLCPLEACLDRIAGEGRTASFWWRDDDAIEWTPELQRLLDLSERFDAPVTLAVIPGKMRPNLQDALQGRCAVRVAAHGWLHQDHARPGKPPQEIGDQRSINLTIGELRRGHDLLGDAFGGQYLPMLVPPWNRISETAISRLSEIGFETLSASGRCEGAVGLSVLNTHVDLIDWTAQQRCKSHEKLSARLVKQVKSGVPCGVLTHHLAMDEQAWRFLTGFLELVTTHPGALLLTAPDAIKMAQRENCLPLNMLGRAMRGLRGRWPLTAMRG